MSSTPDIAVDPRGQDHSRPLTARKNRTLLRLAASAIFLGAVVFLVDRLNTPGAPSDPRTPAPLLDSTDGVLSLTLEQSGRRITLARRDDLWRLTAPYPAFADPKAVSDLLTLLASLEREEQIGAAQRRRRDTPLAAYGLEAPRATLELAWSDRKRVLRIGDDRPLSDRVYARWDDEDAVCVVARDLVTSLPASAGDLTSRQLLHGSPESVARIEARAAPATQPTIFERDGDRWLIRAPFAAPAQSGALNAWLETWHTRPVIAFADRHPHADTNGVALADIRLVRQDGVAVDMRLFPADTPDAPAPLLAFVSEAPPAYLPDTVLRELPVVAAAWRSRRLCTLEADQVRGLLVSRGDTRARLWRDEAGAWFMEEPWRQAADSNTVNELVRGLSTGRWERLEAVLTMSNATPDVSGWQVVLCSEPGPCRESGAETPAHDGIKTLTLRLASANEPDESIAQVGQEPGRYRMPAGWLSGLGLDPLDPAVWLDRSVLTLPPGHVHRIVQTRDGHAVELVRDTAGRWISDPPGLDVDEDAVNRLLAALSPLRTLRYETPPAAPAPVSDAGLDGRDAVSVVLREGTSLRKTIILGSPRADGVRPARVQGHDWVIALDAATSATLLAPLQRDTGPKP